MRGAGGFTRAGRKLLVGALVLLVGAAAQAQDVAPELMPDLRGQVLVLDEDRLFRQSRFGQASLEREQTVGRALEAENARIRADLIAEEQALTTRRAILPPQDFSKLAEAFDQKAEQIRREQEAKFEALVRASDADRTAFLQAIIPMLGELLREKGAAAVIDASTVVVFSPDHDITDEATRRIDAVLTSPPAPTVETEIVPIPD